MKTRRIDVHSVSPGIAIGKVFKVSSKNASLTRTWLRDQDIESEVSRFEEAINDANSQLDVIIARLCKYHNKDQRTILDSHRMFLQDETIIKKAFDEIRSQKINAEWAWEKILAEMKLSLINADTTYLRDRVQDIEYIGQTVLHCLLGHSELPLSELPESTILVANDISPAEVVNLPRSKVQGFIIENGSDTSHNAIVAKSIEIPAVFGFTNAVNEFKNGEEVIIDGTGQVVIASPSREELEHYELLREKRAAWEKLLLRDVHLPTITKDNKKNLEMLVNIELLEEMQSAKDHGAEGVGLYRTEYLFLNRRDTPTEEEQYENYKALLKHFHHQTVVIRTLDLGGDKLNANMANTTETNPALGLRGVRLCLREIDIFKTQIRALLRAAAISELHIMIPLISNMDELLAVKKIFADVRAELEKEKVKIGSPKIGMMMEIPSAVMIADLLAEEVDFFSIGTNDLIQYGMGVDRENENVSELYNHFNPSILRFISQIIDSANKAHIPCSICGEMASDPLATPLFVAWKLNSLSMNTVGIPHIKRIIRSLDVNNCEKTFKKVMKARTASEVQSILKEIVEPLLPALPGNN